MSDVINSFFKDKHGKWAVWQTPNRPLVVWFISMLGAQAIQHGKFHNVLDIIAFASLFTWAWLEIFSGASYFRRVLGVIIMIVIIASRV